MKITLKRIIALLLIIIIAVCVVGVEKNFAAQLSNVSYTYYNDGDMGENPLDVSIKGKKIIIKVGSMTKAFADNHKTLKNFKKVFEVSSQLSRYVCITSDKFTGTVSATKFKKDLKKVKNHKYGSITFYVKGKEIIGYEIYG